MIHNFWSNAENDKLREMWLSGVLKRDMLSHLPGRSMFAISDHARVIGLPARKPQYPTHRRSPQKKAPPMFAAQVLAFREPGQPAPVKDSFVSMPISYAKTCQWIEGDTRKAGGPCFCNGPIYRQSWCLTHWDRVHGYRDAAD